MVVQSWLYGEGLTVMDAATPIHVRHPLPGVTYPSNSDLRRYLENGALSRMSLAAAFTQSLTQHAERRAVEGHGVTLSYRELDDLSNRAALAFARLGLRHLDRVMFQAVNSPDLVIAFLGCLKAGLIPVCTLHSHRSVEIENLSRHASAKAHVISIEDTRFDLVGFAEEMRRRVPSLGPIIAIGKNASRMAMSLARLIEQCDPAEARDFVNASVADIDAFQVVLFQLSGGTTGVPKIIPRLQSDYLTNMEAVIKATGLGAEDCVVAPGPMLHNAGLVCFWGPALLVGARIAIPPALSGDGLSRLFSDHTPTWMYLPKPLLPRMEEVVIRNPDIRSTLRGLVISSGAELVEERLEVRAYQFFGMTEGVIMFTRPTDTQGTRHKTVGAPVSDYDEVRILVPGKEVPVEPGEVGELAFKGPYSFRGYYAAPEQNVAAFTSGGFFRSGDLMREVQVDGARAFVFEGRIKDLVNRGGEKIACEEVERYAREHPAILDAALVPMPDRVYGERACLFVIGEPGQARIGVEEIGRHLECLGLAKFKWPERVEYLDAFPATSAGKLDKGSLRQRAASLASATSELHSATQVKERAG